ncbi:hypothetical protein Baya_10276 [Bagarius yarrelli]|uniref:Uncharacterized protein n=1 Tax=Bagarius yarrelli TaxID=175774 RepID=A0A556UYD6_BAGYA|nr:hypothetical protein Baya_10276 [Bagarius yarrelli]
MNQKVQERRQGCRWYGHKVTYVTHIAHYGTRPVKAPWVCTQAERVNSTHKGVADKSWRTLPGEILFLGMLNKITKPQTDLTALARDFNRTQPETTCHTWRTYSP